jgi:hypothetical protein
MIFCRIVQSGRAVCGVLKLSRLAAGLYANERNLGRTGQQAPVAYSRGTGFRLNQSVANLAEQCGIEIASRLVVLE